MKFLLLLILIFFSNLTFAQDAKLISAKQGMVVTEQHLASEVGLKILKAGGNAIDAAVAVGYALAVVDPCCGNIGGGGFMLLKLKDGKNTFINFRERAPFKATQDIFIDANGKIIPNKSTIGYAAVAVPGTVMGLDYALEKYGSMTRSRVMQPAIELAAKGFILEKGDIKKLQKNTTNFKMNSNVAAIFLNKNKPYKTGDRLVQKNLAKTLKNISKFGNKYFYEGYIAKTIVRESQKHDGVLSLEDFSKYFVEEYQPIFCTYKNYEIITAPLPSSGGTTICEILNIIEPFQINKLGFHSVLETYYLVEAMKYAYLDRNFKLGDSKFIKNNISYLISKEYAKTIQKKINKTILNIDIKNINLPNEGNDTTHYSIIDKFGNAVAVTYTLNSFFGAEVIAKDTGFFLNNEMDDFTIQLDVPNQFGLVQGKFNIIEPGKRPLSSMAPTIILKNNNVFMILGSPGGPKIITSTLETIINVIDHKMNIQDAVNAPRFHHQWMPNVIESEPDAFTNQTKLKLINLGHHVRLQEPWGAVEAIYIDPKTKIIYGANDKRRPTGEAVGY